MNTTTLHSTSGMSGTLPGLGATEFKTAAEQGQPDAVRTLRQAAFDRYASSPLPTLRDEEWRRTDPSLFMSQGFARLPSLRRVDSVQAQPTDGGEDVVVTVSESGFAIEDRSGTLHAGGLTVIPLSEALGAATPELAAWDDVSATGGISRKFDRLNAAFWNFGVYIRAAVPSPAPFTVRLSYRPAAPGSSFIPRVLVSVADGANLRVVEHMESPDDLPLLCIGSRRYAVGNDAALAWVATQAFGNRTLYLSEDWGHVGRDGRLEWVSASLGGEASKLMLGCDLRQPGGEARLSGLYLASGRQHMDQRTLQLHSAPDTNSHVLYKGAARDTGRSVYQGIIKAMPGAIRVDAYQMNNNLILSEGARADSLPGLEIDADDLKCSHGATMGSLDPEQVYYLRTRGLTERDATDLIIAGFYEEIVTRIPFPSLREQLRERIHSKRSAA